MQGLNLNPPAAHTPAPFGLTPERYAELEAEERARASIRARIAPAPVQTWSPTVAALLSFVFPGLGQVYKGQIGEGFAWFFCTAVGFAAFVFPGVILWMANVINAATAKPAKLSSDRLVWLVGIGVAGGIFIAMAAAFSTP